MVLLETTGLADPGPVVQVRPWCIVKKAILYTHRPLLSDILYG